MDILQVLFHCYYLIYLGIDMGSLSLFKSQENRLFQLATVNQQREFMRYLRDLNGWLERDVHDRQSELRGIAARVDQLRDDLHDIRTQGGLAQLG